MTSISSSSVAATNYYTTTKMAEEHDGDHLRAADGTTVLRGTEYSSVHSNVALFMIFGGFLVDGVLILAALLLVLRGSIGLSTLLFGLLIFLALVPIDDKSKFGRKLSRYATKYALTYFPVTVYVEDTKAFDPRGTYVFGFAPHSIMPVGLLALVEQVGFMPVPKIKLLVAAVAFKIPFVRQVWTWMGFASATRKNFCSYLEAGYSCIITPGGAREMLYLEHGSKSEVSFLKSRKGFVKIAIETGHPLVPIYCFGQSNLYNWRLLSSKLTFQIGKESRFVPIISWGRFGTFIPFRKPTHIAIGKPITINKNAHPSIEEINEVHAKFLASLHDLFEKYKTRAGHHELHLKFA